MAAVLAELAAQAGHAVTLVTTGGFAVAWGVYTEEHHRSNERLLSLGVEILANHAVHAFDGEEAEALCLFSGRSRRLPAKSLVSVTAREQNDGLYRELLAGGLGDFRRVARIGDCLQPALIAHAVYAGHRFARELDASQEDLRPRRETVEV
jgi:dimethylamine/trimethylamine dehydrogenase